MISDESLILEFQSGSRDAFEELFARYCDPLYRFFRRRLPGTERAQDLTQETFLAAMRGIASYRPRASVRTYLYAIAMNLLFAERRHLRRSPVSSSLGNLTSRDAPDTTVWLQQALAKLDPGEREILMLREYEQLTYAEIADLLGLPINTVRSRLFRARTALRDLLEPGMAATRKGALRDRE